MIQSERERERQRVEALVDAAQGGDRQAFDRLVKQYQDRIYRLMIRACHHPQDAEEVAIEALARAYERLEQFEGRSSFATWLGRIATNLCLRRREKAELPSVSLEELSRESEERGSAAPRDETPSPEQLALQAEMRRVLRDAVASLPEPDRSVVILRDIEDRPASEVSAATGLTVPAVKSRLHRARNRLREQLNAYFV
ncbi:MAG TPA: sigma-70 family RNA polymerase sigma factor [Armatimonadota bacterium]|jgi:RNA polymerase sigma-70 factor (ECF subfamily)